MSPLLDTSSSLKGSSSRPSSVGTIHIMVASDENRSPRASEHTLTEWLPDLHFEKFSIDTSECSMDLSNLDESWIPSENNLENGFLPNGRSATLQSNSVTTLTEPETITSKLQLRGESFSSSTSTLTSNMDPIVLPPQRYPVWLRRLRWEVFSIYRRLNILVVAINLLVIIIFASLDLLLTLSLKSVSSAVAANIAATVIMRNEIFVNFLFIVFGKCPQWMPLRIRRFAAKIYHLGGVHSGAGISALIWFIVFNVVLFQDIDQLSLVGLEAAVITLTILLDVLLLSIIGLSHPAIRAKWHNTWECTHRYAGWLSVALFWIHFGLLTNADRRLNYPHRSLTNALLRSQVFWLLLLVTMFLVWPWLRLRKVTVHAEPLSGHATRLHFTYTNLPLCAAPRLSDAPLKEWHSFAGIPEEDGQGFSVLVSKAGDWTTKIIQNPPTKLWVRSIPVRGVLHIAPIFKSMVLVATGSGIGPVLSLLYARQVKCRILWSTPHPEKTYQREVVQHVLKADPNAVIINTREGPRPNLSLEAYKLYRELDAEAVFVISNPRVTFDLIFDLESRGVPAFAPIFDS